MAKKKKIGSLILSAGMSRRMNAFKPLLAFRGATLIESTVASALSHSDFAMVVTGYRKDDVERVLAKRFPKKVRFRENPDFQTTDMLTSVKIGLKAIKECDAFFLLPGDMPMIKPETFSLLLSALDENTPAVFPTLKGKRKHPVLISSFLISGIENYAGEKGLKGFFETVENVREIEVDDLGIAVDLDTPEDYERYKEK